MYGLGLFVFALVSKIENSSMNNLVKSALLLSILLAMHLSVFCQNQYSKMVGFVSDNDLFISLTQDQYFTNGLTLQVRFVPKIKTDKLVKKIVTLGMGQYMYTPYLAYVPNKADHDRPFAGYLFFDLTLDKFYKNKSLFQMSYQVGIVGPASQAEWIQKWVHSTFKLPATAGWEYQIQNIPAVTIHALYLKNWVYTLHRRLDVNLFAQANAGTVFDDAGLGVVSRIGFKPLNALSNSGLFHSNIDKLRSSSKEFYFFIKLSLSYVAYDATIQGSLFNNKSPVTFKSKPFVAGLQVGINWCTKRFNFGYSFTYLTKAVDNNRVTADKYGTIAMAYRFQ